MRCCVAQFNFSTLVFSLGIRFSLPYSPRYTEVVTAGVHLTSLSACHPGVPCGNTKGAGCSRAIFPGVVTQVYSLGPKHQSIYADKIRSPAGTSLCSDSPFIIS